MIKITKTELQKILKLHKKWLNGEKDGIKANLRYAELRYADLRYADLRYADLRYAELRYADLRYADLRYADLRYANLDFSVLPLLWCSLLSAKFDKKHYIQFLYHTLKSLEQNDLIDDEFKKSLLTEENIAIANLFRRVKECGNIQPRKQ